MKEEVKKTQMNMKLKILIGVVCIIFLIYIILGDPGKEKVENYFEFFEDYQEDN